MKLTFPDGTVLSLDGFGLLAVAFIVFTVAMCIGAVIEMYLKGRRRD